MDVKPFKKGTEINKQDEDLKKRKLFVKSLPSSCTNSKLHAAFSIFGEVDKAYILFDHSSGTSRGFGFVEFVEEYSVDKSLAQPVVIDGKTIKCSPAILKQEAKSSPSDPKPAIRCPGDLKSNPCQASSSLSVQKAKPCKSSQLRMFSLKEEIQGDEFTKESSGNSSFEKNSKDNMESPVDYHEATSYENLQPESVGKSNFSQFSFYQTSFQNPYCFSNPMQSYPRYLDPVKDMCKGYSNQFESSSQTGGNPAHPQATHKKKSYYKMF